MLISAHMRGYGSGSPGFRVSSGFSLMELAIVLLILGTLMSGVLVGVAQSTANAKVTTAKAQLRDVEEALYGYAQVHGRLPCPATAVSDGAESVVAGACEKAHGFVPVATLDFFGPINTDGLLVDPWQNPVRYSVAISPAEFTDATELQMLYATPSDFIGYGLHVCNNAACSIIYADDVPAVVFSMGANWATYTSDDEIANGGSGATTLVGDNTYVMNDSTDFVSATYSEENFDDQILWLSPYTLFNRLIDAGKL